MFEPDRKAPFALIFGISILMIFVIIGYLAFWSSAPVERSDTAGYYKVAEDLEDFRLERIHYRPPGYPLLLRLVGFTGEPVTKRLVFVQLSLHMLAVLSLAVTLARLQLSRRAIAGFAVISVLPPFVQPAAYVLSENLTQFFLATALAALVFWSRRPRWLLLAAAGLAVAGAALTKPTYQLLGPGLGLVLLLVSYGRNRNWRQALGPASIFVLVSLLPIFVFALFNLGTFGAFTLSPGNLPYSLSTKTVRVLERLPDDYATAREAMIEARDEHLVARGSSHTAEQYYPSARAAVGRATGLEGEDLDALMLELQLVLVAKAPLSYALHVGESMVSFWLPTVAEVTFGDGKFLHLFWAAIQCAVFGGFFLQLFVLGGLAIFETSRKRAPTESVLRFDLPRCWALAWTLPLLIIFYTLAISCLVHHGDPRFRSPTDLLIVFVSILGASIWNELRSRHLVSKT